MDLIKKIYYGLVNFLVILSDHNFILGYFLGFWPALYFFFYAIALLMRMFGIDTVAAFYARFDTVPMFLIIYEGIMFLVAGLYIIAFPSKRFPRGLAYGVGTTIAFIIFIAVAFGLTGLAQSLIK